MPEFGLLDTLRVRMFTSWDGVETLHMSCLERLMQPGLIGLTEPIPDTFGDPGRVLWTGNPEMWWAAPDKWRFDTEYPGEPLDEAMCASRGEPSRIAVKFVVNGDEWAWFKDGELADSGTRDGALKRKDAWFTGGLWFGRPYLSAFDNAQIQFWCNPRLWLANCDLVLHDAGYRSDTDDQFAPPATYRILATGAAWVHRADAEEPSTFYPSLSQWVIGDTFDGDQEFFDLVDFFQLWVDPQTGFVRRFTRERSSGRAGDFLVSALDINQPIADSVFALDTRE
ncbi:MAG: hypothetical protein M0000_05625 [Actinomycetota bacterium]|nr:hypothetical protein [Actinomycetota bacterium]